MKFRVAPAGEADRPAARGRGGAMRLALLALLVAIAIGARLLDLDGWLSFDGLKAGLDRLAAAYAERPALFIALFVAAQVAALALCLPGAVLLFALAGGALFGVAAGTGIVLGAVVLGDTIGFLIARYLLRDAVERWLPRQVAAANRGVERDGAYYLLTLRLLAVIPYFVVNFSLALTRMPARVFAPVSLVGLAPAIFLYVSAGTALGSLASARDILSPTTLLLLGALGAAPILLRLALRRAMKPA